MAAWPWRIRPGCGSSWKQSMRQERARLAGAEVPWRGRLKQGGREVDWVTGLLLVRGIARRQRSGCESGRRAELSRKQGRRWPATRRGAGTGVVVRCAWVSRERQSGRAGGRRLPFVERRRSWHPTGGCRSPGTGTRTRTPWRRVTGMPTAGTCGAHRRPRPPRAPVLPAWRTSAIVRVKGRGEGGERQAGWVGPHRCQRGGSKPLHISLKPPKMITGAKVARYYNLGCLLCPVS